MKLYEFEGHKILSKAVVYLGEFEGLNTRSEVLPPTLIMTEIDRPFGEEPVPPIR